MTNFPTCLIFRQKRFSNTFKFIHLAIFCHIFGISNFALAIEAEAPLNCNAVVVAPHVARANIEQHARAESRLSFLPEVLGKFTALTESDPVFTKYFPEELVLPQLSDPELPIYSRVLNRVMDSYITQVGEPLQRLVLAIKSTLTGSVPESSIDSRIKDFSELRPGYLKRILGDMDLREIQEFTYGKNPLMPEPNSLLGRFISETGAATLVRSFSRGTGMGGDGPQRLVVAISRESFQRFQTFLSREEFVSVIGHAFVIHDGKITAYNQDRGDLREPNTNGSIFPILLLKTTEGQRLQQYFSMMQKYRKNSNWDNFVMRPWKLEGYCAAGGYNNCTHWIGNIPIGDELVDKYSFPGDIESRTEALRLPVSGLLSPHNHEDPLVQRVYKAPGHKQLADVLGQNQENLFGNFASPGWVIQSIIGSSPLERVPVVFVYTQNHREPITPDFVPVFERAQ